MDEVTAEIERCNPALAKGEASQQIERNCREAPAVGESRQNGKPDDGASQFHEKARSVWRRVGHTLNQPHSTTCDNSKSLSTVRQFLAVPVVLSLEST